MRTVRIFDTVQIVGQCVMEDAQVLRDVILLTLMLVCAFALIGLTCFHGSLEYTCVTDCGDQELCAFDSSVMPDGSPLLFPNGTDTFHCPVTLQCAEDANMCAKLHVPRAIGGYMDPEGMRGFDNIFAALMTMVVHMSGDGGMQDLPQAIAGAKASSEWLAWPFFAVCTIVLRCDTVPCRWRHLTRVLCTFLQFCGNESSARSVRISIEWR
jgi:hypothetical protein